MDLAPGAGAKSSLGGATVGGLPAIRQAITAVHPWRFFVVTFAASWLIWVPLVLSRYEIGPIAVPEGTSNLVRLFGVLMPAIVAIAMTARIEGRPGVGRLLGRLAIWRVGWWWWAAALAPALLVLVVAAAWVIAGGSPPIEPAETAAGTLVVSLVFLLLATLGEEIGWRGVALPGLEQRASALRSSIVLGLLWSTWHLPFWMLQDTFDRFGVGYLVLDYLLIVPSTIYITWYFNHSRFSILLPVAMHVVFNALNVAWLPATAEIGPFVLLIAGQWVLTALVVHRLDPLATRVRSR